MITFLPYPNFYNSADCLDKKRCWKQVVEAKQIIDILKQKDAYIKLQEWENILFGDNNISFDELKIKWGNHPTVKMWTGYTECLKHYFNQFLHICILKHNIITKYEPYINIYSPADLRSFYPWWFGLTDFHRSHRARLIEKDPDFYFPLFPNDKGFNNGKYLWPDMKTKTFYVI